MTINKLASKIAKLEGKKSQAHIGDIREILSILSDLIFADYDSTELEVYDLLLLNGMKRSKKKPKAKPRAK